MTVSASICSVIRMMPSSAVSAEAARPVTTLAGSPGASGRSGMRAAVDSQRPEREILGVQMVLQVEDPRKARSVPERVFPRPVLALRPQQIIDAALDGRATRATRGKETKERPRGLTRNRLAHAGELVVVVALAGLAPAAVAVLVALEPAHRALPVLVAGGPPARAAPPR